MNIKYILALFIVLVEIGLFLPILKGNLLPSFLNVQIIGVVFVAFNLFILIAFLGR